MQRAISESGSSAKSTKLVKDVCDYIRSNSPSKITLRTLGDRFGVSPFHLQRTFTAVMGMSPRRYLEECRLSDLRARLAGGEPVITALRATGYSSQSWLYEDSRTRLGMTPATYRNGAPGTMITYATGDSSLGRLLVAATEHGVCSVKAGRDDDELVRALHREFPRAQMAKGRRAERFLDALNDHLSGQEVRLPVDVRGTEFQLKVWSALRYIPLGETRTYSDVAEMIGEPKAVRAVANACASNPVPLIIPCHRVIRKDGSLGGYGLGIGRKKTLLSTERLLAAAAKTS
ncbi:MAG TPA: methylated-DNA--[protein]-cysteine S-methyltransferase [Nitrososphaerales archaeon]|nr:methylated-DNA--[protein]-cysteine S-methyltransferase [Nitrososphaerales archaeon]